MTPAKVSRGAGDSGTSVLEWQIASKVDEIDAIVAAVCAACAVAGFPDKVCRLNVPVSLTEALANAIEQGNGNDPTRVVRVLARIDLVGLCVEVTDEGAGFDTQAVRARCHEQSWVDREDGRGVFLMHALMDNVETWCDVGHTVRLTLRWP